MHDAGFVHSALLVKFLSPIVNRTLAMKDPHSRRPLLPEAIDLANGLVLLVEDTKLLHYHDMVCRDEIQPSSPESGYEDEGGWGLDFGELFDHLLPSLAGVVSVKHKRAQIGMERL